MVVGKVLNRSKSTTLAEELRVADNFLLRLKGLLGTKGLAQGHGLYITPCSAIHMIGMTYAIDCVFVDQDGVVVGICEEVKPWALSPMFPKAVGCIEVPTGTIRETQTEIGDRVDFR